MKALILAGGLGTRLRPLSCTRPKLLFPVLNKPLLDWTLERLAESGVKEAILAVNYMAEAFVQRYGKSRYGMKIAYSKEEKPLRTGGPIKKAEEMIGHEKPFFVLNGDILTKIDYAELLERHEEKDAIATIALYKVGDPSRYGTAKLTENNRVIRFEEKAPRGKAPSNLINAGIYVLDAEIFDYIPSGRPVSIEHEIFPKLANEGKLYGHEFKEFWIDIGKPRDYLNANWLLLDAEIKKGCVEMDVNLEMRVEIKEPAIVDKGVNIGQKSKVGPYAVIGKDVVLGKGARVENSVVFPGTIISDFASIRGAIIGEEAVIGRRAKINEGCIIGDHAIIRDNVTLTRGVTVCPFKEVTESVPTPTCLM